MPKFKSEASHSFGELNKQARLMKQAAAGDIAFVVTPETADRAATAAAWTRTVIIELQNAAGERHEWFTGDIAATIAGTSVAGTASITDTTPKMTAGRCAVEISGDAAAWLAGETNTLTVTAKTILETVCAAKTSVETIQA